MLSKDILGIYEAYSKMYQTEEVIEEEILDEIFEELVAECIEEGYTEEEACSAVEDATNEYLDEAKVTFGSDTAPMRASGAPVGARRRYAGRKAGSALKAAGAAAKGAVDTARKKAAGAVAGAQIAGSIAKDEARRAGRAAQHSVTKAADAVKRAPGEAKKKAKSGIKGFIKRQAQKVVSRMSEEAIQEADSIAAMRERAAKRRKQRYGASDTSRGGRDDFRPYTKADYERGEANDPRKKVEEEFDVFDFVQEFLCVEGYADDLDHAEWMMANIINEEAIEIILNLEDLDEGVKEIADRVVAAAKAGSARHTAAMKGAAAAKKRHDTSVQKLGKALKPAADTAKSAASGAARAARGVGGAIKKGVELERKGAAAVHTLGKKMNAAKKAFTKEDLDAWLEEAYRSAEENSKRYDRARKRAAQRAAARNAARDAGQTGAVPGVGYVTPRREKETYTDSAGKTRHAKGL